MRDLPSVDTRDGSPLDTNVPTCFNTHQILDNTGRFIVAEASQNELESEHPGLSGHLDALCCLVRLSLEGEDHLETIPEHQVQHIAYVALQYFVKRILDDGHGLVGATEAAEILGVTRQRMSQIAREGAPPRPIAWVGGARPMWLSDDVAIAKNIR